MNFEKWLEELKKFWMEKDIPNIVKLFDAEVEYYESPFEKIEDINIVWKDIEEQEIKKLEYHILGVKENVVIANYILELPTRKVDMVYEIQLDNNNNKCHYFKQWYMSNN